MKAEAGSDPYDLMRFVMAQEGVFERACAELAAGAKSTHWMWFIFPQLSGLGSSAMAVRYAIGSLDEAATYAAHPILGPRLRRATNAALSSGVSDPCLLFGAPDDKKFRSSMTLFGVADPSEALFQDALRRFFGGAEDPATLAHLKRAPRS